MGWIIAYVPVHILCAVLAYGTFYHMATLRKCEGGWKEVDFEMLGVTTTLRVVTKFIVGFFALAGGPVILAIWFGLNWASGIPSGLRFRKSR